MIPGIVVKIGDKKYLMPPMNVEIMELHGEFLQELMNKRGQTETVIHDIVRMAEIVCLTLKQNYPELSPAEVKRAVNFSNAHQFFEVLFKVSGFEETVPGE